MNTEETRRKGISITQRTALLSWMVTTATLLLFVVAIIPQQKQNFLQNLESKAQSVFVSLGAEVSGAAINADYSSVVTKCEDMLNGDPALDYLVITKNDGFSLIFERTGWTSETNAPAQWRPKKREKKSGISVISPFNRRVFYHTHPFDYSGIQWGWIHVGLSLKGYDHSVKSIYWRTSILTVLCISLSLLASGIYAKRLLQPILHLRLVVHKVANGDLGARAAIRSNDELGSLARSVNTMTESLQRRDQILQSVRYAAQQFLSTPNWRTVINEVLAKLGQAAEVSRIRVFEKRQDGKEAIVLAVCYEWVASGVRTVLDDPQWHGFELNSHGLNVWNERFAKKEIASIKVRELEATVRAVFESGGAQSVLVIPIMVENDWWGVLSLAECTYEREWTEAERDSIRAAVDMLGAAIVRQQIQDALIEAKENLELRVNERTRELQIQVVAKERARAELAETQIQLMETSRRAGMAEIATGVLHNVGNVLNSVNVSATVVNDRIRSSKIESLVKASQLLLEHEIDMASFLAMDPRGQRMPSLIINLANHLEKDQRILIDELNLLVKNIDHIKDIVAMQQSYAKVAGILELLPVTHIVEDAIQMNDASIKRHGVQVFREYEDVPLINIDKHKVMQILLNIIRNAKYAMDARQETYEKCLRIHIGMKGNDQITITIKDNGIGIPPENLIRIFSHGFTTRKDGHGFGLHMGALAAKEMGGSLTAFSDGPNQGALFELVLPINQAKI